MNYHIFFQIETFPSFENRREIYSNLSTYILCMYNEIACRVNELFGIVCPEKLQQNVAVQDFSPR